MASKHAQDLRRRIDAASENLSRQLQGMDAHMERADAPGEWTTREVLSHLLFEPGFDPAVTLATFSEHDYPVVEIAPGDTFLDEQRRQLTLSQFRGALDAQRRRVLEYIEGLEEPAFERRKARIPFFKQFMGTDEITIGFSVRLSPTGYCRKSCATHTAPSAEPASRGPGGRAPASTVARRHG